MSDNIVLERLREIHDILGELRADVADVKAGLGFLESAYSSLSRRLDRQGGDMERIKRRLDIADVPAH